MTAPHNHKARSGDTVYVDRPTIDKLRMIEQVSGLSIKIILAMLVKQAKIKDFMLPIHERTD